MQDGTMLHDSGSTTWTYMVPLIVVSGSLLAGLATVDNKAHHDLRTRHRWPVVTLLFVASMAHVPVIAPHLEEAPYMGVLFIAFSCTSFTLASLLAWKPAPWCYPAAGILCAAAIVAYAATRLVAFPLLADDVGAWWEPLGIVSVLAEAGVVAIVSAAGLSGRPTPR
jgi:hypothetical protein